MSWQFLLGIGIIAEVAGRLIQRILLRDDKSDPIAYTIVFNFLTGIFIGVYALINGFKIPDVSPIIPNLILMVIFYGLANIFIFQALKLTEASLFSIIFTSRVVWIIAGAILLLHEAFAGKQFLGAFLIIVSVVMVSIKKQPIKIQKGEILALLAAFLLAAAITNNTFIVKTFDVPSYLTFVFIVPAFAIWAFYPQKTKIIIAISRSNILWKIFSLAVAYGISSLCYLGAYKLGNNAAQIGTIFQTSGVLTVLLAIFLLNEKSGLFIKIIASVVSFIGVILVS